jgi:hypothetical protein
MQGSNTIPAGSILAKIGIGARCTVLLDVIEQTPVALNQRVVVLYLVHQKTRHTRILTRCWKVKIGPVTLLMAFEKPSIAKQLQMSGYARLTLSKNSGQLAHGNIPGRAERKNPQSVGFSGCPQDGDELIHVVQSASCKFRFRMRLGTHISRRSGKHINIYLCVYVKYNHTPSCVRFGT